MALTDNLVAYRKLNESSGNAADEVWSHTLTAANINYDSGYIWNCASFDGVSSELWTADHADFDFWVGDFSFSFWSKADTTTNYRPVIFQRVWTSWAYVLVRQAPWAWTGDQMAFAVDTGWVWVSLTTWNNTHSTGVREHRVFTRGNSAADYKAYKNWILIKSLTGQTARNWDNAGTFYIGRDTAWNWRDGMIDEVGVRKWKELSQAEVTQLYNVWGGLTYPFTQTSGFMAFF